MPITINGRQYKVIDSGGYNHDIGAYWKMVKTPDGNLMVVGSRGSWRFWHPSDRTKPLREAIARGWPNKNLGVDV